MTFPLEESKNSDADDSFTRHYDASEQYNALTCKSFLCTNHLRICSADDHDDQRKYNDTNCELKTLLPLLTTHIRVRSMNRNVTQRFKCITYHSAGVIMVLM